jgi:hypothetical protein
MALFNNERINKNNAQLIFTTTTPALMDELYPHEVYLVDKNKDNTEYVYPVSNITGLEVKRNNMCSLYKVGRLGGSPILHGRPL